MPEIWVLILIYGVTGHGSMSITSFPTEAACEAAGRAADDFSVWVNEFAWECAKVAPDA